MKGQTLWGWERGSGGLPPVRWWKDRLCGDGSGGLGACPQLGDERTDFVGMGAGVWGWNPQLGDESPPVRLARSGRNNFWKKKVFERTLFEQKFSYIYTAYFSFEFSFEIRFFSKERHSKESQKWKKFERTDFETNFSISKERYSIKWPRPSVHFILAHSEYVTCFEKFKFKLHTLQKLDEDHWMIFRM